MDSVSVLIPARNEPYLQKTVDSLFDNAVGEVEVLVVLDGWNPPEPLQQRDNLTAIYREKPKGMRSAVNVLAAKASGRYLMKVDAHCAFAPGWDEALKAHHEDDWLSVPSRYRLNVGTWTRHSEPLDYLRLTFPYSEQSIYGTGFHGAKWIGADGIGLNMGRSEYYYRERERQDVLIDDVLAIQGSCWFCTKEHFNRIDGQDERFSYFYQEPQEMVFKTWLIGGRCVVNKHTWYAHLHKEGPSNYGMRKSQKYESERFSTWVWMNDKWPRATRKLLWLVDHFWPLPGWPDDWQSYIKDDRDFTIFDINGHDGFKANGSSQ